MATKITELTESEIQVLKGIIQDVRSLTQTQRLRGKNEEADFTPAPIYIALPPTTGIPRLDRAPGTGTGTSSGDDPDPGDVPGSAVCQIWMIVGGALVNTGLTQTVYNISEDPVGYNWIIIWKDAYGKWVTEAFENVYLGVANHHINQGSSGLVTRYSGATSATVAATKYQDLVYARMGAINHGSYVYYVKHPWGLEGWQVPCPVGTGT